MSYFASCVLLMMTLSALSVDDSLSSPATRVVQGRLSGSWMKTRGGRRVAAFRGVPYAQPPVKELRFQSPKPVKPWRGTKSARDDGANCVQHQYFLGINGEEDCLYLNIYTPNITEKLPVLFFIHGGAFKSGSGSSFLYGPQFLLDQDIVLVTLNYRLGIFGFLTLEDTALPGNLGLKDQRAALRWVRDNIAQFGGDPTKVTIFGESSGAQSVHYHMLFNNDEGLFRAGILHSGSAYTAGAFHRPGEQRPLVEHLLEKTRCTADDKTVVVECLRKVRPYRLVRMVLHYFPPFESLMRKVELGPVIEPDCVKDAFVTEDPWKKTTSLPLLIGTNKYEGLFTIVDLLKDESDNTFGRYNEKYQDLFPYNLMFNSSSEDPAIVAESLKSYYLQENKIDRSHVLQLTNLLTDGLFNYGTTEAVKNNINESYLYSFNYQGSKSLLNLFGYKNNFGPTHVDELFLFFPFPLRQAESEDSKKIEDDKLLSQQMIQMWTNFVTFMKPTLERPNMEWAPVSTPELQCLDINGPNNFTMEPQFFKERMDFWASLPFRSKAFTGLLPCSE